MNDMTDSRLKHLTGWLSNEGRASGDLANYLWACRPHNWERNETLTENDLNKLGEFSYDEINAAIDLLEEQNGNESSR